MLLGKGEESDRAVAERGRTKGERHQEVGGSRGETISPTREDSCAKKRGRGELNRWYRKYLGKGSRADFYRRSSCLKCGGTRSKSLKKRGGGIS